MKIARVYVSVELGGGRISIAAHPHVYTWHHLVWTRVESLSSWWGKGQLSSLENPEMQVPFPHISENDCFKTESTTSFICLSLQESREKCCT